MTLPGFYRDLYKAENGQIRGDHAGGQTMSVYRGILSWAAAPLGLNRVSMELGESLLLSRAMPLVYGLTRSHAGALEMTEGRDSGSRPAPEILFWE